jgi:ABC-type phosphate transport system substrate-binding protein
MDTGTANILITFINPSRTTHCAVGQIDSSLTRANFSKSIHGKPVSSIKAYWQQRIFTGRGVPPVEKDNDREVLNYVKANPGAIGYVSNAAKVSGVKVVNIVN